MEVKKSRVGKVGKNYHIALTEDMHFYSVPKEYVSEEVKMIYSLREVGIYQGNKRIAVHQRDCRRYQYSTKAEHMPVAHQHMPVIRGYSSEEIFVQLAQNVGEHTRRVAGEILQSRQYVEQSFQSVLDSSTYLKNYSKEKVEKACSLIGPTVKASYIAD